ncbi:MAG: 5'-3' exonuclease H3TH domain-containing protein, partial [Methylophilaceae bacterium]|nr:5'-3' exonuclease H3TH domain-containing protein [Methylophilaceae bacterium]
MKTLLLVDGSSYLYRAFHAMPDLRNAANEPTGAIHGVLNMLRRLHKDYPADYCACVFDAKGKTFRDDMYPDYKANRAAMPDDLRPQIEPLHEAITALGWPLIMIEGVEADDVIGALAKQAESEGIRTIISTGDKDISQLVNEHITVVNTMRDAFRRTDDVLDVAGVERKFGIPPRLIIDYLTLIGDKVDNVPGVEKVGPKTAVKWLQEYGSLDGIMAHAQDIKGKVGEHLRDALAWLPTAKALITIRVDIGRQANLADLAPRALDKPKLLALFDRFELRSWKRDVESMDENGVVPTGLSKAPVSQATHEAKQIAISNTHDLFAESVNNDRDYETILTQNQLNDWLEKLTHAELICFDTETTSLNPMQAQIVGLSFSVAAGKAAYLPLTHDYFDAPVQLPFQETLAKIKPILENPNIKKVGQNLKYDKHILANHGVALNGIAHDTLLQSYVLESHRTHNMDDL